MAPNAGRPHFRRHRALGFGYPLCVFRLRTVGLVAFVLLALMPMVSGCVTTVSSVDPPDHTLTAIGMGRVSIAPDITTVTLGVNARATTVAEATEDAAKRMNAILAQIKGRGVAEADITTLIYSVDARTAVPRVDEPAKVVGYQVNNLVQVTVRKVADLSAILDAAVAAGANVVREIHFTRADAATAQSEARTAAVNDALAKIRQLAAAAGLKPGRVLSIRESPTGRPVLRGSGMGPAAMSTPIEPGQLDIVVTIELRQAITP